MLLLVGLPRGPCPFFMFWQLCMALCEADGEGLALADAALAAVAPVVDEVVDEVDDVVDDGVEWVVAALATATLPPNPTPSAPAPTAAPIMILPSLDFNVSASSRSGDGPEHRTPARAAAALQQYSADGMKTASRITPGAAGVSGREGSR